MSKDIKFRVHLNVDGKDQIVTATTSVKDLQRSMKSAKDSATRFHDAMVKFAGISTIVKDTSAAVEGLAGKLNEYQNKNLSVQQQTQLTGEAMSALRSEVQAVADTYGKDFSEVLTGVSRLMKGFGISSEEAMRLVRDGMMSGADATGQMFDILSEYPAYFKEAGMNAEQFMAVITNGANMGVFNDKAADTIKEGNLRLREMTTATARALDNIGLNSSKIQDELKSGLTTTFQVMQQVGAKLKELPQTSAEVGAAIADIFGGPGEDAGLAYIESLADMELGMEKLKEGATDSGKALDGQVDTLKALNNVLTGIVDQFNVLPALQPFVNITSQIGMTLVGVGSLVSGLKSLNIVSAVTSARLTALKAVSLILTGSIGRNAAIVRVFSAAATSGAYSATALKMALRGLMISTGVGAVIAGVTIAIEALVNGSGKAKKSIEALSEAQQKAKAENEQLQASYADIREEVLLNIVKLREFKGSKEEEKKLVAGMNDKYGDALGYYDSVANWYTALTRNSEAYCQQMLREIQLRSLANKAAVQKQKADDLSAAIKSGKLSTKNDTERVLYYTGYGENFATKDVEIEGTSERAKAVKALHQAEVDFLKLEKQMAAITRESAANTYKHTAGYSPAKTTATAAAKVGKATTSSSSAKTEEEVTGLINVLKKKISDTESKIGSATDESTAARLVANKAILEKQLSDLRIRIGLEAAPESKDKLGEQINDFVKGLSIEPIEFDVEGEDCIRAMVDAIGSLSGIDLESFESVRSAIESITEIEDSTAQGFATAGAACTALGNAMRQLGKDSEAAKAGMVLAAVGNIVLSFAQALASCKTWVEWLAFGISGTAQMISLISTIQGFATGGIVGGNSKTGDKLIARVNSGEMILNSAQQARLWKIVNGYDSALSSSGNRRAGIDTRPLLGLQSAAEQNINVTFTEPRWRGTGMVLGIQNVRRVMGKSGRKG